MNKLCDDTNNIILSFLMKQHLSATIMKPLYLSNEILILSLTSKYWKKIISCYITEYKKNTFF